MRYVIWLLMLVCASAASANNLELLLHDSYSNTDEIKKLESDIVHHYNAGDIKAALVASDQILESFRFDDINIVAPMTKHGVLHMFNNDLRLAEKSLFQAVEIAQSLRGKFTIHAVTPLHALGEIYIKFAEYDRGMEALREAQHILQRKDGVKGISQGSVVSSISKLQLFSGDKHAAVRSQIFYLMVFEDTLGKDNEKFTDHLDFVASNLLIMNRGDISERLYYRYIAIVEKHHGEDSVLLIYPLQRLAYVSKHSPRNMKYAVKDYDRIVQILTTNPESDKADIVTANVTRADMQYLAGHKKAAISAYIKVWKEIEEEQYREEIFGQPIRLFPETQDLLKVSKHVSFDEEFGIVALSITATYDIDKNGKPTSVKIAESNISKKDTKIFKRWIELSKFRPRIANGKAVPTTGLSYTQSFINM